MSRGKKSRAAYKLRRAAKKKSGPLYESKQRNREAFARYMMELAALWPAATGTAKRALVMGATPQPSVIRSKR